MKSYFLTIIFIITSFAATSQSRYSAEMCWNMAKENYPSIKSLDLINKSNEYSLSNANNTILPNKILFNTFNKPNQKQDRNRINIIQETPIKNQKGNTLNSLFFDNKKPLISKGTNLAQDAYLADNMYSLSDRINNLYFSLILIDKKIKLNELFQLQIDEVIKGVSSNKSSNTKENITSLEALKKVIVAKHFVLSNQLKIYMNMLSLMIGETIKENDVLLEPNILQYMGMPYNDIELNSGKSLHLKNQSSDIRVRDDNFKVFDISKTAAKSSTDNKANISNNVFRLNLNRNNETELNEINKLSNLIQWQEKEILRYKEILDVTYSKVLRDVTDISNLVQDLLTYDAMHHTLVAYKVQMMMSINKYRLIYQK